jgi:hypothetical protein
MIMRDPLAQPGYDAYYEGYERTECPCEEGTDGEHAWLMGWDAANKEYELKTGEGDV